MIRSNVSPKGHRGRAAGKCVDRNGNGKTSSRGPENGPAVTLSNFPNRFYAIRPVAVFRFFTNGTSFGNRRLPVFGLNKVARHGRQQRNRNIFRSTARRCVHVCTIRLAIIITDTPLRSPSGVQTRFPSLRHYRISAIIARFSTDRNSNVNGRRKL